MGLKIDMEKAYDKLKWNFLLNVLKCFGFPSMWIQWVMQCVTTPLFSILINGNPYGFSDWKEDITKEIPYPLFSLF